MSRVKGHLSVTMAWDAEDCEYLVTADDIFRMLPKGVNANVYYWDDELVWEAPENPEDGDWVLEDKNWEDEDA